MVVNNLAMRPDRVESITLPAATMPGICELTGCVDHPV
jgi:hypothetical protein